MKHPSTNQVFAYWDSRRGQRAAPERADIEPGEIRRALADTFILAADRHVDAYFRLAGTRLCALFTRELKNTAFSQLWGADAWKQVSELLAALSEEHLGFAADASGENAYGQELDVELLVLPLGTKNSQSTRILGVLAPRVIPYWLGVSPFKALTLKGFRTICPLSGQNVAPFFAPLPNTRPGKNFVVYQGGRRD